MSPIVIYFLQFDDTNIDHLSRHAISSEEIEQMTANAYITTRNTRGPHNRIYMLGRTDGGRSLTIVLAPTYDEVVWRPITGWESTAAERKLLDGN